MYKNPTNLKLLECIFRTYRKEFEFFDENESIRKNKIYVPIDCKLVAKKLKADPELIFGRLYYHLANEYKYQQEKNVEVKLFEFLIDGDKHCVHFPLLASVVSGLKVEYQRYKYTLVASIFAVIVALGAATITGYDVLAPKHNKALQLTSYCQEFWFPKLAPVFGN